MTPPDRFGLQGSPEIQDAPREGFGQSRLFGVLLGLRLLAVLMFLMLGPGRSVTAGQTPPELGWAGFAVSALQVPVLLWGLWLAFGRKAQQPLVVLAFGLSVLLDSASRLVSDLALGRPLDTLSVITTGIMLVVSLAVLSQSRRMPR